VIEHRDADLSGSRFRNVDLTGTRIHSALLHDVVTTDAWIDDVRIEGEVRSLTVNGVDATGYVEAELARRHPELDRLRPEDVEGLRRAWAKAIARSEAVVERARRIPADRLDADRHARRRTRTPGQVDRPRHDVHRWRHGHRHDHRAHLNEFSGR
jgi:hypothetical protein